MKVIIALFIVGVFVVLGTLWHRAYAWDVVKDGRFVDVDFITRVCLGFARPLPVETPEALGVGDPRSESRICYDMWPEAWINTGMPSVQPIITMELCEARQAVTVPGRNDCFLTEQIDGFVIQ